MFRAFFFRRPATSESAATRPSPRGGGLGRGHSPNSATFPNTLTASIQAFRLVALSLTLSHGREDGVAVGVKGSARKTGCAGCFLFFRRPEINGCKPKLLLKLPATAKPAAIRPLPRGGGLGRGHSPNCSNLSQHTTAQIQALRLVALSLTLSHGREDGVAVGVKGSARKTGCAGCFLFFRRPEINGCKPKLLLKLPATAKPAAIRPLPRGGGLGRGHSPNCSNLSQHTTAQIQALRLVALSLTLSHGERGRVAVGIKGSAKKSDRAGCFCFSDDLYKRSIQAACTL